MPSSFSVQLGDQYGSLRVIKLLPRDQWTTLGARYECLCDCGKKTVKNGAYLRRFRKHREPLGGSMSCGCQSNKKRFSQHGTPSRYNNQNCRCPTCKKAWAVHMKEYYHRDNSAYRNGAVKVRHIQKNGRKVARYRKIMEDYLGRTLLANESVHHINGDKSDDRIENLQLRVGSHGSGIAYECLSCGSDKVGPAPLKSVK